MSALRSLVLLTVALAPISACSTATRQVSRASPVGVHGRNDLITRGELRGLGAAATVGEVIQRLRPEFLRGVTVVGLEGPARAFPAVYLNDRPLGGLDELDALSVEMFLEARKLSAAEARSRYGSLCRCDAGVIAVRVATSLARRRS